jgi:hypothetical protein
MTNPTRFAELFRQDLANRQSLEAEKKKQQEVRSWDGALMVERKNLLMR